MSGIQFRDTEKSTEKSTYKKRSTNNLDKNHTHNKKILFNDKNILKDSEYLKIIYNPPTRPYSQKELLFNRRKLIYDLNLGEYYARHLRCKHFYLVRKNSKKEKEIIENGDKNPGNCSVCWRIRSTPEHQRDQAIQIINIFEDTFSNKREFLSYDSNDIENIYYRWLYEEL